MPVPPRRRACAGPRHRFVPSVLLAAALLLLGAAAPARSQCWHGGGVYSVYSLAGGCSGIASGPVYTYYFAIYERSVGNGFVWWPSFPVNFRGQTNGDAVLQQFVNGASGNAPPGVQVAYSGAPCRCQNPATATPKVFFELRYGFGPWRRGINYGIGWSTVPGGPFNRLAVLAPLIDPAVGTLPDTCEPCTFAADAPGSGDDSEAALFSDVVIALHAEAQTSDLAREWAPQEFDYDVPPGGALTWVPVGQSCDGGVDDANRGKDITAGDVFCFEGPGGDSTWPAGPGGSDAWTSYSRYDTQNDPGIDLWHLEFDPHYRNRGNTCEYTNDWMFTVNPPGIGQPIASDGFCSILVTPPIDVSGWTGGLVAYSEYMSAPPENEDATNQLVRVLHSGHGWSDWLDPDGVPDVGGGEAWDLNRATDFSAFLGADIDSLQIGFEVFDFSGDDVPSSGNHTNTHYLIDNVSIASFDGTTTRFATSDAELFSDTFALSDPAHNARRANADEGTGSLSDEEMLNVTITDFDGISASDVALWWRVGTGSPLVFGAWTGKTMTLSAATPGSGSDEGTYVATIGADDGGAEDRTGAGDGVIWQAGATIEYYVRAQDLGANVSTYPAGTGLAPPDEPLRFSILPNGRSNGFGEDILLVEDTTGRVIDIENSGPYSPVALGFELPWNYDSSEDLVERSLALIYGGEEDSQPGAAPRWDIYNVAGADAAAQREPRGQASAALSLGGLLDAGGAPAYDAVVWITGALASQGISEEAQNALAAYLDAGGNLLVFGDNVAWNLGAGGLGGGAATGFLETYLGAQFPSSADDRTDAEVLDLAGEAGTCFENFACNVISGCPTRSRFDRLTLAPAAPGSANDVLAVYAGTGGLDDGRAAVIRNVRTGSGGVAILCGFDAAGLTSDSCRADLLHYAFEGCFGMATTGYVPSGPSTDAPVVAGIDYALAPASPSPFRSATSIRYAVPARENVRLAVYNVAGQRVRTLVDGPVEPGQHEVRWNGRTDDGGMVASGVYLYRFEAAGFTGTRKVTLLR